MPVPASKGRPSWTLPSTFGCAGRKSQARLCRHLPPREPVGETELQIVRTVPEKIYKAVPNGDFRILESYLRAFKAAEQFIYLENQFLWSPEIAAILADKLSNPPSPDFRLVVLLPSKPNSGSDDTRGVLGELVEADDDNGAPGRLHPLRPRRNDPRPDLRPRQDRNHRRHAG